MIRMQNRYEFIFCQNKHAKILKSFRLLFQFRNEYDAELQNPASSFCILWNKIIESTQIKLQLSAIWFKIRRQSNLEIQNSEYKVRT